MKDKIWRKYTMSRLLKIYNSVAMMFVQFKNYLYHENGTHPPHTDTSPFL